MDRARDKSLCASGAGVLGVFRLRRRAGDDQHHCANECLQQLSGKGKNYFQDGYSAKSPADEQRCPAMELNQLDSITDVTERMQTALRGKDGAAYTTARQAEESAIEKDCAKDDPTKWRCDVISLYHGGRTALYRYRRYQDVRMVMAPDQNAAFFGGDPDNFNFPRYDLDMAFLRVYENGKPAKVDAFLPFDAAGPKEGELVFTSGNPGSTEREVPLADLEFSRNVTVPFIVDNYSALDGALCSTAGKVPRIIRKRRSGFSGLKTV